jgi:excinuclease ABC subunit C
MKAYKNIGDIRMASVEQLKAIPEIPENIAEEIYAYFHEDTDGNFQ